MSTSSTRFRVFIFIAFAYLSIAIVPIINIISSPGVDFIKIKDKSFLYNMDFLSRAIAKLLYPLGININSRNVIIGKDGWLFLGDNYSNTITIDHRQSTKEDGVVAKKIIEAMHAWKGFLSQKGVQDFKILIAPNKGTVYPEYMPAWAVPRSPNATDILIDKAEESNVFIDLRKPLLSAKKNQSEILYYKTDTHWNLLGGATAFRYFSQQLSKNHPELKWPQDDLYKLTHTNQRNGGDLANFLRLTDKLHDLDPIIKVMELPITNIRYDFDTNQIIYQGANPLIESHNKPLLIKSAGALNNKKVLWLRDSFGTGISPFMVLTFSEVLQVNYDEALKPGGRFEQLIEKWRPDYVFFIIIERDSRRDLLYRAPPITFIKTPDNFESNRAATLLSLNNIKTVNSQYKFVINGIDPFLEFSLSDSKVTPEKNRYINLEITCEDHSPVVPIQLFWLENKQSYFDKERSVRMNFATGRNLIDIQSIPKLSLTKGQIAKLRLDIDPQQSSCQRFNVDSLYMGNFNSKL